MENASKALLIAGGMLLVMMIIALIVFAWGRFSEFYSYQEDLVKIQDTAEFNLQFTAYDRNDVYGYEIISLMNKVIDYNFRSSNDANAKNDNLYTPMTIRIHMAQADVEQKISYTGVRKLFTSTQYSQGTAIEEWNTSIKVKIDDLESTFGKENLQSMSKSIGSIFPDTSTWTYTGVEKMQRQREVINKFNSLVSSRYTSNNEYKNIYNNIKNYNQNNESIVNTTFNSIQTYFKDVSYTYYEYTQFKKAKFASDSTKIQYDDTTGRIIKMEFDFTGEVE